MFLHQQQSPHLFTIRHVIFFKFALCFFFLLLFPPAPQHSPLNASPFTHPWIPPNPHPLTGATPPSGRSSRCVLPLSLTTTSRARRATRRPPSRAPHALHPLIRGTARTGTPSLPLAPPSASQHASVLLNFKQAPFLSPQPRC